MSKKERYIVLNDMQIEDTQNRSQDWLNIKVICRRLNKQDQQISDLEAKLAEKEKEMERMSVSSDWTSLLILKQEMEMLVQENKVLKQRNQDKISFCIDKLEEVKKKLNQDDKYIWAVADLPIDYCKGHERSYVNTIVFIDNQIKQLKEGK